MPKIPFIFVVSLLIQSCVSTTYRGSVDDAAMIIAKYEVDGAEVDRGLVFELNEKLDREVAHFEKQFADRLSVEKRDAAISALQEYKLAMKGEIVRITTTETIEYYVAEYIKERMSEEEIKEVAAFMQQESWNKYKVAIKFLRQYPEDIIKIRGMFAELQKEKRLEHLAPALGS